MAEYLIRLSMYRVALSPSVAQLNGNGRLDQQPSVGKRVAGAEAYWFPQPWGEPLTCRPLPASYTLLAKPLAVLQGRHR